MACVYGAQGNMDKTMGYLRNAFARKANGIRGEGIPNPSQDDSFQRFMANDKFRKFAASLSDSNELSVTE